MYDSHIYKYINKEESTNNEYNESTDIDIDNIWKYIFIYIYIHTLPELLNKRWRLNLGTIPFSLGNCFRVSSVALLATSSSSSSSSSSVVVVVVVVVVKKKSRKSSSSSSSRSNDNHSTSSWSSRGAILRLSSRRRSSAIFFPNDGSHDQASHSKKASGCELSHLPRGKINRQWQWQSRRWTLNLCTFC